jgi:hypothetical protein
MTHKRILTLLVCTGLGLSLAVPAMADSVPTTATAQQKIEEMKAKREAAIDKHAADKKAKLEDHIAKKEAKIEQHKANKEATVQAHKDATAAKKEILEKNREAIKASKGKTTP